MENKQRTKIDEKIDALARNVDTKVNDLENGVDTLESQLSVLEVRLKCLECSSTCLALQEISLPVIQEKLKATNDHLQGPAVLPAQHGGNFKALTVLQTVPMADRQNTGELLMDVKKHFH